MQLKNLQKSLKIYERLKALDAEIIAIDKLARTFVSNEVILSVKLQVERPKHQGPGIDTDGYEYISPFRTMFAIMETGSTKKSTQTSENTFSLSETDTFFVLNALMISKQKEREELLQKLQELGVN